MTWDETKVIMGILKTAYPNYYKDITKEQAFKAVDLWAEMFEAYPLDVVKRAVKAFIASDMKGFPPVIGHIIENIRKIENVDELTEGEAWNLVRRCLCNCGYDYNREYAKLPPEVQYAVGNAYQLHEWACMDSSTVDSVVNSNFTRGFRNMQNRYNEMIKMPEDVKKLTSGTYKPLGKPVVTDENIRRQEIQKLCQPALQPDKLAELAGIAAGKLRETCIENEVEDDELMNSAWTLLQEAKKMLS